MPKLGTPTGTLEVLRKYDFHFQKKYGQNFLIDPNKLEAIVDAAGVGEEDCVLEIGPGIGTLTQYLAERAGSVIAVEDILKVDIARLSREKNGGRPFKVVANLPYYITTPIIMKLFESHAPIDLITIMVQTEVAERMQEGPGSKEYGALSLAVQYYSRPEIVAHVPAGCFIPAPKVGSSVIRLTRYEEPPVKVQDEAFLFRLIRASFNQRRKTLINGLGNAEGLAVTKTEAAEALRTLGISENVRGEALSLEQFARLSDLLSKKGTQQCAQSDRQEESES